MNVRLRICGIVLSAFGASACVPTPVQVTCVFPPLPAELDKDPPPPGWFSRELDRILDQTSTPSPAAPTN